MSAIECPECGTTALKKEVVECRFCCNGSIGTKANPEGEACPECGGSGRSSNTTCEAGHRFVVSGNRCPVPTQKYTDDFLRHAGCTPSQYDRTCRVLAAEVLRLRSTVEAFDVSSLRKGGGSLTAAEILVACRNVGVDLTCGGCAALFYTGVGLPHDQHTCDRDYENNLRNHEHDLCACGHSLGAHDGYGDTPTLGRCKHCKCGGEST